MKFIDAVLNSVIIGFSSWTIAQNLAFFLGMSPAWCVAFAAVFLMTEVAGLLWLSSRSGADKHTVHQSTSPAAQPIGFLFLAGNLVVSALAYGTYVDVRVFAIALLLVGILSLIPIAGDQEISDDPGRTWSGETELVLLVAFNAGLYSLFVQSSDADDVHYLAASANVARSFYEPLAQHYPIFPYSDVPPPYPTFSIISFHDLIGVSSHITSWQPYEIASYVLAPLGAALLVLTYFACLKQFVPKAALCGVIFIVAYLFLDGGRHHSFGGFSFARIWQGKSLLLHIGIPLLLMKLQLSLTTRSPVHFAMAGLTIILCTGLSSIALWLVPPLVVAFCLPDLVTGFWRRQFGLIGGLAGLLVYPTALIGWAYSSSLAGLSHRTETVDYKQVQEMVFGSSLNLALGLFTIGAALLLMRDRASRRRLGAVVLVFVATFGNPLIVQLIASTITSAPVYWRIWWFLPFTLLIGAGLGLIVTQVNRWMRIPIATILITTMFGLLHRTALWNHHHLHSRPALKTSEETFSQLLNMRNALPDPAYILAPSSHSAIVPTLTLRWYSMMPREIFSWRTLGQRLDNRPDHRLRMQLTRYLSGQGSFQAETWSDVISQHPVNVVIAERNVSDLQMLRSYLAEHGYHEIKTPDLFVWIHDRQVPDAPFPYRLSEIGCEL